MFISKCCVFCLTLMGLFYHIYGKVIELDNENFDEVIIGTKVSLVAFYAPWCGACKRALPKFEEASKTFEDNKEFVFAKVNAYEDRILGMRFHITSFPTFLAFPYTTEPEKTAPLTEIKEFIETANDLQIKYESRKKMPLKKKAKKTKKTSKSKYVVDIELKDFEKVVLDPKKHVLLMFYAPGCKEQCGDFVKVAESFQNEDFVLFARLDVSTDKKIAQNFNIIKNPTLYWFPMSDKIYGSKYDLEIEKNQLVRFVNENTGTTLKLGGEMLRDAGVIKEIDNLIKSNIRSIMNAKELEIVLLEVKGIQKLQKYDPKLINYYVKILSRIQKEKDADKVIQTEYDVINDKLIRARTKKENNDIIKERNILDTFLNGAAEIYLEGDNDGFEFGGGEDVPVKDMKTNILSDHWHDEL